MRPLLTVYFVLLSQEKWSHGVNMSSWLCNGFLLDLSTFCLVCKSLECINQVCHSPRKSIKISCYALELCRLGDSSPHPQAKVIHMWSDQDNISICSTDWINQMRVLVQDLLLLERFVLVAGRDNTFVLFSPFQGECKSTTHGSEFRGTSFIKTATGITCQRWDKDTPHNNSYNDDPSQMQKLGLQGRWVIFRFNYQKHNCSFFIVVDNTRL